MFDYENRLTEVKQDATSLATFLYDADGNRVKGTVGGVTTVYIAGIYERQGAAYTSYYEGGGLRRSGYSSNNGVFYMLSDHLKSTSAVVARNGVLNVKYFYYPYGARRGVPFNSITAKRFAGQYHEASLPGGEGLSFYNTRWYDPKLGSFLSADSIVPAPLDPQSFNRYAYAGGNPLRFSDPSGHTKLCGAACEDEYKWSPVTKKGGGSNSGGSTGAGGGHGGDFGGSGGGGSYFGGDSRKATNGGRRTTQTSYSSAASTREAWMLVFSWFLEIGPRRWSFGPDSSLTQDVMHDPGMQQFREEWAMADFQLPFEYSPAADRRNGGLLPIRMAGGILVYAREHLVQLPLSTAGLGSRTASGPVDAVGGIIGSLDQVSVTNAGNGLVKFTVINRTGWASGTRIPGTDVSLIQNRDRSEAGPGGTLVQYFYWWEPMPGAAGLTGTR